MGESKAKTEKQKPKTETKKQIPKKQAPKKPVVFKELKFQLKVHEPHTIAVPKTVKEVKVTNGDFGDLVIHVYNSKQVLKPNQSVVLKRMDSITFSSASMPTVKVVMFS